MARLQKYGIVGGYVVATRSMKFRIRAGPAQTHTYASVSFKYVHCFGYRAATDLLLRIDSSNESRAITAFFISVTDKAAAISLH